MVFKMKLLTFISILIVALTFNACSDLDKSKEQSINGLVLFPFNPTTFYLKLTPILSKHFCLIWRGRSQNKALRPSGK